MADPLDIGCSLALVVALTASLGAYAIASLAAGHALSAQRVEREQGLPVVGRAPMHAVYRALVPLARGLVHAGVSANAVTFSSLVLAAIAAMAFAFGHLGVGAAVACVAGLADAVDGLVAREGGTATRFGRILDTTIDRYVDALLLGGLAVHVRHDVPLLVTVLAAIIGAFMVSYASSVERELGLGDAAGAIPMRRAHRLAYVLTGATLGPLAAAIAGPDRPGAGLVPVLVATLAIAVIGNGSAVRRLACAARRAAAAAPLSQGARR